MLGDGDGVDCDVLLRAVATTCRYPLHLVEHVETFVGVRPEGDYRQGLDKLVA